MRFSRHAKNNLRLYEISRSEAELVVRRPERTYFGWDGKPNYDGSVRGIPIRIIVALDDADMIVTIYERR